MAQARDKQQWNHTAQLLALLANAWLRKKGARAYPVERFHPYLRGQHRPRGMPLTKGTLGLLALAMKAEGAPAA